MASAPPPICARIRATRERLQDQARADGGPKAAAAFSQEAVARRVGVTLKAYRAYEHEREPSYERRRQIASALGFDQEYFESSDGGLSEERLRQIFRDELAGLLRDEETGRQLILDELARLQKAVAAERRRRQ